MATARTGGIRFRWLAFMLFVHILCVCIVTEAFSVDSRAKPIAPSSEPSSSSLPKSISSSSSNNNNGEFSSRHRRESIATIASSSLGFAFLGVVTNPAFIILVPSEANAYTPDPDPLRESLYLLCRVQEATCLQERYIQKASPPIKKMKLTLRLVDRSYRLIDQINYVSKFIDSDNIVAATLVGNEAADALQDAIDFVYAYQKDTGESMTKEQKDFLMTALSETREKIFDFVSYLPDQTKLLEARTRVETENKLNVDEFDPDLANDAGIYNPIELPWKTNRRRAT